jgi:RES domain
VGGATPVCVPTLYVGKTYEAAAFETVFREVSPFAGLRFQRESELANRGHAVLELMRDLVLGPFFHQNLGMLGQTRGTMIDTDATAYPDTAKWAAAVHDTFPDFDGLIWTSRQHDRDYACVLFGDRVSETDIIPCGTTEAIDIGPGRSKVGDFAKKYGIDILP